MACKRFQNAPAYGLHTLKLLKPSVMFKNTYELSHILCYSFVSPVVPYIVLNSKINNANAIILYIIFPILSTVISSFPYRKAIEYNENLYWNGYLKTIFISIKITLLSLFLWSLLSHLIIPQSEYGMPFSVAYLSAIFLSWLLFPLSILAGSINWLLQYSKEIEKYSLNRIHTEK